MGNMVNSALLSDPKLSSEQRVKEIEYKRYVDEHIENVQIAWENMKKNTQLIEYFKQNYDNIEHLCMIVDMQIRCHDYSKFSVDEWEPYRKQYYSVSEQEKNDNVRDYEAAEEHHYQTNLHHWNWWAKTNNVDDMGFNYVIEMCCDWIAMSIKYGGNALDWYLGQKNIKLGWQQTQWVKNILKLYYNK